MRMMGLSLEFLIMDTKPGYCHGSSGKLVNQHMINDHMLSHYKKLYSAKAAVDCSVPKSMQYNVKYVDQKRREQLKKVTSVRSDSQGSTRINSRASSSSKNSQCEKTAYHYLDQSAISSPRISTSFHSKRTVYPSPTVCTSASPADRFRSSSELQTYGNPNAHTGRFSSDGQRGFKTFQDPTQKTYSGDVLSKHAHRFTPEKPFTPRTLKSDHKSTLLQYRYYTPPRRKDKDERSSSLQLTQEEMSRSRSASKRGLSPQLETSQTFSVDHEWSDEESGSFRRHRTADFLLSSSRVSPEGMRSPIMKKVTDEEEELMYLEFIADVTNEILVQGLYSDRVLKRVFERQIDMNKHRLDENKMRHLLDNLHNDLQKPSDVSVSFFNVDESDGSLKPKVRSSNIRHKPSSLTVDDFILHSVFDETRDERETITPDVTSSPVNKSFSQMFNYKTGCEISLNDKEHLTCSQEHLRNTLDNNEDLTCPEEHLRNTTDDNEDLTCPEEHLRNTLDNNEDLTCPEEHLRNTADDNEVLEQVDKLEKSLTQLLNASERSESEEEKIDRNSDDDEF